MSKVCKHCGYCEECGRGYPIARPYVPYYPYPYSYPYWHYSKPYTWGYTNVSGETNSQQSIKCGQTWTLNNSSVHSALTIEG